MAIQTQSWFAAGSLALPGPGCRTTKLFKGSGEPPSPTAEVLPGCLGGSVLSQLWTVVVFSPVQIRPLKSALLVARVGFKVTDFCRKEFCVAEMNVVL